MQMQEPFIHLFQTGEGYYIYDVNTNKILRVTEDIYEYMKNKKKTIPTEELTDKLNKMQAEGYLSSKRVKKIHHSHCDILPCLVKNKLNMLILQVTQQCNLRCSYCAYSGSYQNRIHENQSMSIEVAKKGIDFLIENSSESDSINIGFYGGEPLLRFDFIKECVEYAKEQAEGKEVLFTTTINGTLLTEEVADFFVENNFSLMISIDGPEELHDKNRVFASNGKGTFKKIMSNVEKVKNKYPQYVQRKLSFNAVLDGCNNFDCTNKFFCEYEDIKDLRVNINSVSENYANATPEVQDEFIIQNDYEWFKYLLYKLNKLDAKYASKLFYSRFNRIKERYHDRSYCSSVADMEHPGGPCIPGITRLFLSVDGTFYPCERVSELSEPMKIGNIHKGFDIEKMKKLLNIGELSEDVCKNCWAYRFCYLCAIYADDLTGLSREKKLANCASVRFSTEQNMKDYCTLQEFNYDFDEENYALQNWND